MVFYWYFYQDCTTELEVKLTGRLNVSALEVGEKSKYGSIVKPQPNATYRQSFFNIHLDMMLDGVKNSLVEVNTVSEEECPENPYETDSLLKQLVLKLSKRLKEN